MTATGRAAQRNNTDIKIHMVRNDKELPASAPRMVTAGLWYIEDGFMYKAIREHPDKPKFWKVSCARQGGSRHRQAQSTDMEEQDFLKSYSKFLAHQPNQQPSKAKRPNILAMIRADKLGMDKLKLAYQASRPSKAQAFAS